MPEMINLFDEHDFGMKNGMAEEFFFSKLTGKDVKDGSPDQ